MSIKKSGVAISEADDVRMLKKAAEEMKDNHNVRISDEEFTLPKELLDYMRQALGRNAEGLEKSELANRFFGITDMYLEHGMRYDIPGYMFDFPREIHNALFYINGVIVPLIERSIAWYYLNEHERFVFTSEYYRSSYSL